MRASERAGAAAFLETFVLIGVALGGTALVMAAASAYAPAAGGGEVMVQNGSASQGRFLALVSLTVMNEGEAEIPSFDVAVIGAPQSAEYCYSLFDGQTLAPLRATCPALTTDPRTVAVPFPVEPGRGLVLEVTIMGSAFQVGSSIEVVVTASTGGQASQAVAVVPA